MKIGYRIIRPDDVGAQAAKFAQISLWRTANWGIADGERAVREAIEAAGACKALGMRTVYHPLDYPLTGGQAGETLAVMRRLAAACDLGIILHDEGGADGKGLSTKEQVKFEQNLLEVSRLCRVSIENSYNSAAISRFWERFVVPASDAVSITLDIGHLELAGIDSITYVRTMPQRFIERMRFVHMHHHDAEDRHVVKDHKPLVSGCREIEALKVLLARKPDVWVILELDAAEDGMRQSMELLQQL